MSKGNKVKDIFKPAARKYMYRVTIAGLAVAAFYGIIAQEAIPVLTSLAIAVLAVADANVPE